MKIFAWIMLFCSLRGYMLMVASKNRARAIYRRLSVSQRGIIIAHETLITAIEVTLCLAVILEWGHE